MRGDIAGTVVIAAAIGVVVGIGGYTFFYAKGASYLTDNPQACANCHVMQEEFDGWIASSHRAVAVCNDCHTPESVAAKYVTKAINGWNHSVAFTSGRFHEPIQITPRNLGIAESACRTCHQNLVDAIDHQRDDGSRLQCSRCHRGVGHL